MRNKTRKKTWYIKKRNSMTAGLSPVIPVNINGLTNLNKKF